MTQEDSQLTSVFLFSLEELLDLVTNFAVGNLHIILSFAIVCHERKETIVGNVEL